MRSELVQFYSPNGKTNMLVLKPNKLIKNATALLWLHGGGYITGMKEMIYISRAKNLVDRFNTVVFSPGYRLSLQSPFPAGFFDCLSALDIINQNAHKFKINKNQIMIGGESAGGGLTAAVTLFMRDTELVNLAYQMPLYPMISCFDTSTSKNNYHFPWNTLTNHIGWKLYGRNLKNPDYYFSPSLAKDLTGLPPAYSFVGNKEPFLAETVDYFSKLKAAGVPAELDIYSTGFHAFDMLLPHLKMSKLAAKRFEEHFDYAQHHYFSSNE